MDILVTVEGQKMRISSDQKKYIEGSRRFVKFRFDLSEEWDGIVAVANFVQGGKLYAAGLDSTNCAYLPTELKEGECLLSLFGEKSEDSSDGKQKSVVVRATTTPILLILERDITTGMISEITEDTKQSNYDKFIEGLKDGVLANKVFNEAITEAVKNLDSETLSEEVIANKNNVAEMRNELIGEDGTNENPSSGSTLGQINQSRDMIFGEGGSYDNPGDNSALKEIRTAKSEIVGADNDNTAVAPSESSALGQVKKSYDQIIGENNDYDNPGDNTALKEIRSAKSEIIGDNSSDRVASATSPTDDSALGQIRKSYNRIIGENNDYDNPADNSALKEIRIAKSEIIGSDESNTADSPSESSALGRINESYNQIIGTGRTPDNPDDSSALKRIKDATEQIVGISGTAQSPIDDSALGQVKKSYNQIIGENNDYDNPADNSALKEIRIAKSEIIGDDGSDGVASATSPTNNSALGQIKNSCKQILGDNGTAAKPIQGSALSQVLDAMSKTIDACDIIVGSDNSVENPKDGSALSEARKSQQAAADSAAEAAEYAKSANLGITVVDNLATDTDPNITALSANQGKVLNESKLDKSGDTMTGKLTLDGDPTEDLHAATKKYVDTLLPEEASDKQSGLMSKEDCALLHNISSRLGKLQFVVSTEGPSADVDDSTITIVVN